MLSIYNYLTILYDSDYNTYEVGLMQIIWVNFITTSLFSRSLESWVYGKSSPAMVELFRLVNHYNLPR